MNALKGRKPFFFVQGDGNTPTGKVSGQVYEGDFVFGLPCGLGKEEYPAYCEGRPTSYYIGDFVSLSKCYILLFCHTKIMECLILCYIEAMLLYAPRSPLLYTSYFTHFLHHARPHNTFTLLVA